MSDLEDFNFSDHDQVGGSDDEEEFDIIDNSIFKSAPSTKTVQISDKVDVVGLTDDDDMDDDLPLSLEEYQQINRDIVNSQVVFLHPRGVLMVGSVLSAFLEEMEEDGPTASSILFKVLFVEGGSQPAMFRCKTPVYTSPPVKTHNHEPKWKENTFRFDMVMPEEGKGFNIYGEIIISVYRVRATGGNDLLGQVTFDLSKISKTGTVEYFQDGIDGRSLSGKYSLLMGNKVVGEIEIQLNIAWKSTSTDDPGNVIRPGRGDEPTVAKSATKTRASSNNTKSGAPTRPKSAGGTAAGGAPGAPAKFVVPPQRKIPSKLAKRQKEEALRIERENKFLVSKIQKHRGNNELAYNPSGTKSIIAQLQYGLTNEQAYTAEAKATARLVQEKQKKGGPSDAKSSAPTISGEELANKLYLTFTKIKKDISLEEDEIKALKGKLSNLNIHIKKYTANIQRLKQKPLTSISGNVSIGGTANKVFETEATTPMMPTSGRRSGSPSIVDATAQPKRSSGASEAKGEIIFIENNYPLTDAADGEYKSVKEEYDVMQKMRRALIERIHNAKQTCGHVDVQTNYIESKRDLLKLRLLQMVDEFGQFFSSEELQAEAKSLYFDSAQTDPDFMLYAKHRSLQEELILLEATTTENPDYTQIISARDELKSAIKVLKERKSAILDRIDELRVKKGALLAGLKHRLEDTSQFKIRQQITMMLGMERKIQSHQRQEILINGIKEYDVQLLRLKYRAKEREKVGFHPELLKNES
jgi:hypothetical protein